MDEVYWLIFNKIIAFSKLSGMDFRELHQQKLYVEQFFFLFHSKYIFINKEEAMSAHFRKYVFVDLPKANIGSNGQRWELNLDYQIRFPYS